MQYRHELSAIISATSLVGGPLVVLGDVLERRVQSGEGLTPAEVRAAVRLVAAARQETATRPTVTGRGAPAALQVVAAKQG
jgi:hypothetical protein